MTYRFERVDAVVAWLERQAFSMAERSRGLSDDYLAAAAWERAKEWRVLADEVGFFEEQHPRFEEFEKLAPS